MGGSDGDIAGGGGAAGGAGGTGTGSASHHHRPFKLSLSPSPDRGGSPSSPKARRGGSFLSPPGLGSSREVPSPDSPRSSKGRSSAAPLGTPVAAGAAAAFNHLNSSARRVSGGGKKNFKVVIRIRPPLQRELNAYRGFQNVTSVDQDERVLTVSENLSALLARSDGGLDPEGGGALQWGYGAYVYTFDFVYGPTASQKRVYDTTAREVVESSLQGYNATIFAYGQTGTGKTFTMEGFENDEERGIIPRAIEQIFGHVSQKASLNTRFLVRASYLQIYNETISDLLKPERGNLMIREDPKKGVYVEGLSEWVVRSPEEIYGLMRRGGQLRATGSTRLNKVSSRSHAVFIIIVEQSESLYVDDLGNEITLDELGSLLSAKNLTRSEADVLVEKHVREAFRVGKLNFVDLAGSERVRVSGAKGQRLEETKKINQSLSALGNVIAALTESRERQHIPYRDSKLTRILEDSLGGNCKTTMMAMVSPALESMAETLSTVKFAHRAKNIKNDAVINEDLDQRSLLRKYERELKRLRAELAERNRNVVDKRQLLLLEEQRKRAEADKMAAIRALESRSVEFMREKEEKRLLEQRIQKLTSQMMGDVSQRGGMNQNEEMRLEYEGKLADLERERESIEEQRAQVDRYRQLLLKQRDIMIALTRRLNERDNQIVVLREEIDRWERQVRELEEQLDAKTAQLIHLEKAVIEHNAQRNMDDNADLVEAMDWGDDSVGVPTQSQEASSHGPFELHSTTGGEASPTHSSRTESPYRGGGPPPPLPAPVGRGGKIGGGDFGREADEFVVLLQEAQSDMKRMTHEIDALRAEKASLETLLKEKLDRLVQAEIEVRIKNSDASTTEAGLDIRDIVSSRGAEVSLDSGMEDLKRALEATQSEVASRSEEVSRLGSRCERLAGERRSIQIIMEQKILVLVENVASCADAALSAGTSASEPMIRELQKDIGSLRKLVKASLIALKNAETADSGR